MIFLPVFIFIFGLIIGSFLNVVILRLNTGRSISTGRSRCSRCDRTLLWYELVPVVSFLGLRGKCRTCHAPLSFQYPLVELLTAIVFVMIYTKILIAGISSLFLWVSFIFAIAIAALLIVIVFYDLRHKIIPDKIVFPFIGLSLLSVFWNIFFFSSTINSTNALLAGPLLAAPFFFLWFFSQGRAMGFGDVKLALGIGWLIGIAGSFTVFLLSFWIGAALGLLLLAISRGHSMKSELPFAPFLIISLFIVFIWGVDTTTLFPFIW